VQDWEDEKDFSVSAITAVFDNLNIHAQIELVVLVDKVLNEMSAWCEQCPCHAHVQSKYRDHIPVQVARSECGDSATAGLPCPLRGCRAPEVADGELLRQLDKCFSRALGKFTLEWRCRLSEEDWAFFLSEFAKGKSHVVYIVTMKTENWLQLPWAACVVGHFDEDIARRGARKQLASFLSCPDPAVNHRVTMTVFTGIIGEQLQQFVGRARRDSLPEFYKLCCKFAGIPITERMIERPHGTIKLNTAFKNAGPLRVTSSIRFPEVERDLKSEEDWRGMCECVAAAKATMYRRPTRHTRSPLAASFGQDCAHAWLSSCIDRGSLQVQCLQHVRFCSRGATGECR